MIYILETELLNYNKINYELKKVYGISNFYSTRFCKKFGFCKNCNINDLSNYQLTKFSQHVEQSKILINNDLKKLNSFFIKKLFKINSYKKIRRLKGYPVRGQRTHTNAKTAKKFKFKNFKVY